MSVFTMPKRSAAPARTTPQRIGAALTALAMILLGLVGLSAPASAGPSAQATCVPGNPMGAATPTGSVDGYTIFVKENAILANSELEGTLAVLGTATFGDDRSNTSSQYPIFHGGVGGNSDYTVPTIDGGPNRVLIQQFASVSKVVQVKNQGAPSVAAGVKIGDQSAPADYTFGPQFGGPGSTYFPASGGNMSPQIDSTVQPWTDLAAAQASWGITKTTAGAYFPADSGSTILDGISTWTTVAGPAGNDQPVVLDGANPSKLTLADFAGIHKFTLQGFSAQSFLVIEVQPSDVVNGTLTLPTLAGAGKGADREGISHLLFDMSSLTGDVNMVTPVALIRGAIYAPNAHVIFPTEAEGGREYEGQIIARNFTALQSGKEIHTNLFKGRVSCDEVVEETGTFDLNKVVAGGLEFPAGVTFPVTASWTDAANAPQSQTFNLPADGTVVASGLDLPEGTVVTLAEGTLPTAPAGWEFVSAGFSPQAITILADGVENAHVTLTNTYKAVVVEAKTGGFTITKTVVDPDGAVTAAKEFTVNYSVNGGAPIPVQIKANQTLEFKGFEVGTTITISEDLTSAAVAGATHSVTITPQTLTIVEGPPRSRPSP